MKTDQNKQRTIKNNGCLDELNGAIQNIQKAMYGQAISDTYDAVYYCKDCMKDVKIKDGLCKHMGNNKLKEDFSMTPKRCRCFT